MKHTSNEPTPTSRRHLLLSASAVAMASLLQACGGGGGGGGGSTDTPSDSSSNNGQVQTPTLSTQGFVVVPGLGAFSSGATVSAINPADGSVVGTAQTDSQGEARLELVNYLGPFVLRVTGGNNVTYYDEATSTTAAFGSADSLFALVPAPANRAVANGVRIAVTPLTHMAAAFAGVITSSGSLPTLADGETYQQVMLRAYARVRQSLGWLKQSNTPVARALNPLLAPRLVSATATRLDVSSPGAYQGVYLAQLAIAASTAQSLNPLDFAKSMFAVTTEIRTELLRTASAPQNFTLPSSYLTNMAPVLRAAAQALTDGRSGFIQTANPTSFDSNIQAAFVSAVSTLQNPNFTTATRDELFAEISAAIQLQLTTAPSAS